MDQVHKSLIDLKRKATQAYFNHTEDGELNDMEYDALEDLMDGLSLGSDEVGCEPNSHKCKLPLWMGSLSKVKMDRDLTLWLKKVSPSSDLIVQPKLDGVSCLVTVHNGSIQAFTRGDGSIGTNITCLLPYIEPNLFEPNTQLSTLLKTYALRGELMVPNNLFNQKYSSDYANPRSFVSSLVIRRNNHNMNLLGDLDFVVYELIRIHCYGVEELEPLHQLNMLSGTNIHTVKHTCIDRDLVTEQFLSKLYRNLTKSSRYIMDGLVLVSSEPYSYPNNSNPTHSVAFKLKQAATYQVRVIDVLWNVGKTGILRPKVQTEPVQINGSTLTYFTAFNAKFIKDKGIGPGATLLVTKAGDVIPYIMAVVVPVEPKLPNVDGVNLKWSDTGVDILTIEESVGQRIRQMVYFATAMDMHRFKGETTIRRLYNNGCCSVNDMLTMDHNKFLWLGPKLSDEFYRTIQLVIERPVVDLLIGYDAFGTFFGRQKIMVLFNHYPNLLTMDNVDQLDFNTIHGFSKKTSIQIHKNMDRARAIYRFIIELKRSKGVVDDVVVVGDVKDDIKVCLSGFREININGSIRSITSFIRDRLKWTIVDSVTRQTTLLIVKNGDGSSKVTKAQKLNIPILTIQEFVKRYG